MALLVDEDRGRQAVEHVDLGPAMVGMKPCTKALYVSLISRCDSAVIVPRPARSPPDPETPVKTVSRRSRELDGDVLEVVLTGAVHTDPIVAVSHLQRSRLRVHRRGHAVSVSIREAGPPSGVSVGVILIDSIGFQQYVCSTVPARPGAAFRRFS